MLGTKTGTAKKSTVEVSRHFVFIEAPILSVGPEAMLWGEASWWPKSCVLRFTRLTPGDIAVGTVYQQQIVKKFFALKWQVAVTRFEPNRLIERTFQSGMLKGFEVVMVGERSNGTRVDYELHYEIRGLVNKILWPLFYKKKYGANIELVLSALKAYALQLAQAEGGGHSGSGESQP